MAEDTPIYDLMLLLSMNVEDDRRAKIMADVETAISSGGGSIVHNGNWGTRPLSYRIEHQEEAEYHLLQFNGPPALLETLTHSLGITDGVLRSRIIKVLPGTPPPPTPTPVAAHAPATAHATSTPAGTASTEAASAGTTEAASAGTTESAGTTQAAGTTEPAGTTAPAGNAPAEAEPAATAEPETPEPSEGAAETAE